jgi:hypothetical protein
MTTINSFFPVFFNLIISLLLLLYGFFALFNPRKLGSYISLFSKGKFEYINKMIEKDSFYLNLRIGGIFVIVFALLLSLSTLKTIF